MEGGEGEGVVGEGGGRRMEREVEGMEKWWDKGTILRAPSSGHQMLFSVLPNEN